MKTKKIEDIKKSIMVNNKNINNYPKDYITGDEFEKWLKDKKKDSIEEIKNNSFTIKCNNCGREIELKDYFKEQKYKGIDIFDLMMGGVLISCECGNEIKSERLD